MGQPLERLQQLVDWMKANCVAEYRDDVLTLTLADEAFAPAMPALPEGFAYMAVPTGVPETVPDDGRLVAEKHVGADEQTPPEKHPLYDNPMLYPDGEVPRLDDDEDDD